MLRRVRLCGALPYLGAATEPQHTPYVRAERARVDRTAYILHPRTRGFYIEGRSSRASDPCIPTCVSQCVVVPHRHSRTTGMTCTAGPVGPGWPHGPWRLPAIAGTPHRCRVFPYHTLPRSEPVLYTARISLELSDSATGAVYQTLYWLVRGGLGALATKRPPGGGRGALLEAGGPSRVRGYGTDDAVRLSTSL